MSNLPIIGPFIIDVMTHPLEASVVFAFGLVAVLALRWKERVK
jgi:hypothetical protein